MQRKNGPTLSKKMKKRNNKQNKTMRRTSFHRVREEKFLYSSTIQVMVAMTALDNGSCSMKKHRKNVSGLHNQESKQ